jgi:hypothetical protein
MPRYGTGYGGWWLPDDHGLGPESYIVSAGVGEDISFDMAIHGATGCKILLLDPTERAAKHLEEVKAYYALDSKEARDQYLFSGSTQVDYKGWLSRTPNPDWSKIEFKPIGLWREGCTMKFYKQENPAYVSQSFVPGLFSGTEYTLAKVDCLIRLVPADQKIDLLKLDIEGAEMPVLDILLEEAHNGYMMLPRLLCVEFDAYLKGKDPGGHRTGLLLDRLRAAGYEVLHNANWNMTFRIKSE